MKAGSNLTNWLTTLSREEFARQKQQVSELSLPDRMELLIEACRVIDLHHVISFMSNKRELGLSHFDFATMFRGWNPLASLLLPSAGKLEGVPLRESTPDLRDRVFGILMNLGITSLLRESSEMIRHGMADCVMDGDRIIFRMSERCAADHFLDRLEGEKWRRIEDAMPHENRFKYAIRKTAIDNLDDRIRELVYPWRPVDQITMVGYDSAPDIEQHHFTLVAESAREGMDEAGIHNATVLGDITGMELNIVVWLITSFYLKHIHFVDIAKQAFPDVNYAMSLTIWKSRCELVQSITSFTGMDEQTVTKALDLISVGAAHASYFEREVTPLMPMLINVTKDYVLEPVSSVFRNPFSGIRMLHEAFDKRAADQLRKHREEWMISELYNLFLGSRYRLMDGPTVLRLGKKVLTDIDAAVFDTLTGVIALFQLKWQDFSSNDVAKQRSRAKNFVEKVDAWTRGVQDWIRVSGSDTLLPTLRLGPSRSISEFYLFAIGRSGARFRSYGYEPQERAIASATWSQFIRLRHRIGPTENVFREMHSAIQEESIRKLKLKPLRQEFLFKEHTFVFENLLNAYEEEETEAFSSSDRGRG